jgi:hypothetical protein
LIYSLLPVYLLTLYVLLQEMRRVFPQGVRWSGTVKVVVAVLSVSIAILTVVKTLRDDVIHKNFPLGQPDSAFILPEQQALVDRLKPLIGKNDGFFTMTSEAAWYYLLDQPCPVRYPYLWTAVTAGAQEEVVRDLADKKVKWVLYRDGDWSYRVDGIGNDEKFPIVNQYILNNYQPCFSVEGNEVWVLKGSKNGLVTESHIDPQ